MNTSLRRLFADAQRFIYTPEELALRCDLPHLPDLLKKRQGHHFPSPPRRQGDPHIIVHFPIDTSRVHPRPMESDPHSSDQVLLQVKDNSGRYCAALFEEIRINGAMHYLLCDITFDRYLHNRPPAMRIDQPDIDRFFKRFSDTVLSSVDLSALSTAFPQRPRKVSL